MDLIQLVQPSTVFVELDSTRAAQLRSRTSGGAQSNDASSAFDLSKITSNPMISGLLGKTGLPPQILEAVPTLLKRIGWLPPQGGEMKAALDEADRIGARCCYGDVEFSQTMTELKMSFGALLSNPGQFANIPPPPSELAGMFGGFFGGGQSGSNNNPGEFIESIKTRDNAKQMTKYLSKCFPPVYHVMITKRDMHMAKMLRQHCSIGKVVAVVGMAHMEGIEREWEKLK